MMKTLQEVNKLNGEGDILIAPFTLKADGYISSIWFAGIKIWQEDDDNREFDEDINDWEPLKDYLVAEARTVLFELSDALDRVL
jgi:hypothetical protein